MSYLIDRLDDYGRGITKLDDKTCFVSNALVGEDVNIEITNIKSKYIEANSKEVINKSSNRQVPRCPFYLTCGGCNIMHMNYDSQLEFKKNKVEGILHKFADIDGVVKDIIPSDEFNYRNKVTLKVINNKLGYFKDKSNDLVAIDKCLLVSNKINEVINKLNSVNLNNIDEVLIRSNYNDEVLLCLIGKNIEKEYYLNHLSDIDNIVIIDNNDKLIIKGNDYIIDKIDGMLFKVSVESFFQVNSIQVKKLYDKVLEYAKLTGKERVLDLYCGTGTIGMFLSKKAKYFYGIEINESAVKDANYNKKLNNINNIEFLCEDANKIKNNYKNIDLVVVDPPRSGLGENAIKTIVDINPKRIVYVSCDPVTLARDLKILQQNYLIKELTPVDMFPNTYHIETISVLCRKTIEK